jgi:putative transposase
MDEQYLRTPFYGVRKMLAYLRGQGHQVNVKRIRRLMRLMGLEAIYQKPRTSKSAEGHKIYPYLLKGIKINQSNQVWCADITYIPMRLGFLYLVAVMDWFSRFVLSWRLSNSLETRFCLEAVDDAFRYGLPEIFNVDQGAQFTSESFTSKLETVEIKISMDGRGRVLDNIFIERLWRSLKYEYVYLNSPEDGRELWRGLNDYFVFYNYQRHHQALGYRTPAAVYKNLR